jgi:hypothetical protein
VTLQYLRSTQDVVDFSKERKWGLKYVIFSLMRPGFDCMGTRTKSPLVEPSVEFLIAPGKDRRG